MSNIIEKELELRKELMITLPSDDPKDYASAERVSVIISHLACMIQELSNEIKQIKNDLREIHSNY